MTDTPPPMLPPGPAQDLPPSYPPGPPGANPFRVYRSRTDRRLGGVSGGLAVAAGIDSTLVRIALALGALTGWGLAAYVAAWIVLKEEDPAAGRVTAPAAEGTQQVLRIGLAVLAAFGGLHVLGGLLSIVFGILGGLGRLFFGPFDGGFGAGDFGPDFGGRAFLGLLLVVGGSVALVRRHGGADREAAAPPRPSGPASWSAAPAPGPAGPPPAPGGRTGREWLLLMARAAGWLLALWFLLGALGVAAFWAAGAFQLRWPVLPAAASAGALGALSWALLRSRRPAVVGVAAAALVVPVIVTLALVRWDGQAGYRSAAPTGTGELERTYRHGAGQLDLDLSGLRLPPGQTEVAVDMGVGGVSVTVPWDATVIASAEVGAGRFELFGRDQGGFALEGSVRSEGEPGAPVLVLETEAGIGSVDVERAPAPETRQALERRGLVDLECRSDDRGNPRCQAPDAYPTPELSCLVSAELNALCRPAGQPFADGEVSWEDRPGTRRCLVPEGGGPAVCEAPVPDETSGTAGDGDPPASPLPDQPGTYLCEIPPGGGTATCRPA